MPGFIRQTGGQHCWLYKNFSIYLSYNLAEISAIVIAIVIAYALRRRFYLASYALYLSAKSSQAQTDS
jgi:hypothetical protein